MFRVERDGLGKVEELILKHQVIMNLGGRVEIKYFSINTGAKGVYMAMSAYRGDLWRAESLHECTFFIFLDITKLLLQTSDRWKIIRCHETQSWCHVLVSSQI